MNILIVDDDELLHSMVRDKLEFEGYEVTSAYSGISGLDALKINRFDLILLDMMMPGLTGIEFIKKLRSTDNDVPVIMLTSVTQAEEKVNAFKTGADDYLCKPFYDEELIARIRAVLKRSGSVITESSGLEIGSGYFDFKRHLLTIGNDVIECRKYETLILRLLSSAEGKIISRDEILHYAWGSEKFPSDRTIDNYIVMLRKKVSMCLPDLSSDVILESVYGSGYRLNLPMFTSRVMK